MSPIFGKFGTYALKLFPNVSFQGGVSSYLMPAEIVRFCKILYVSST